MTGLFGSDNFCYKTQNNGSAYFGTALNGYSVMIVRPDVFSYIPFMCVQNVNITGTYYLFGSSFSLGRNVGYGTLQGNVVVKNGADVTLEVSGGVLPDYGCEKNR